MTQEQESVVEAVLREGGAVVVVEVRAAGQRWLGRKLIAGRELEQARLSRDEQVRLRIEEIGRTFHFEAKS